MKTPVLMIIFLSCLFACNDSDTEYTDDELVDPESVMSYEENDTLVLRKIPAGLSEWMNYYDSIDTAFVLRNFKASGVTLHMDVLQDAISSPGENAFTDLYIYSPDSTQYIDLVSYNYIKDKTNGKNILISGDPDQQVVLADSKTKKKKQLMYNGPAQLAEFAAWTGNSSFIIGMTSREDGTEGTKAELYLFHLKDSIFTNFLLNHPLTSDSLRQQKNSFLDHYFASRNYQIK
jgi:hypothetical protein